MMVRLAGPWWETWPILASNRFPEELSCSGLTKFWLSCSSAASMTAFQDLQATAWRDVAIGEIPEIVVYRNPHGTFTRSVTAGFIIAVVLMLLVRGANSCSAILRGGRVYANYGHGLCHPKTYPENILRAETHLGCTGGWRSWHPGSLVFVGQIVGKWTEGGWVVLISFSAMILVANAILLSPIGHRDPKIHSPYCA